MRVTFGSLFRNGLLDINRTAEDLVRRQREIASGRRIHVASDDPAAMAVAMGERVEMASFDQFTPTTDAVVSRLRVVESVHTEILDRLTNVQSRGAAGRATILSQTQRDTIAGEIRGAARAVLTAVSTSYRGMYLFSGGQSLTPPYLPGPPVSPYQGDARVQSVDVARDRSVQVTFDGAAILQGEAPADLFQSLEALAVAVETGDMAGIEAPMAAVTAAFERVTTAQTQVGIELARLGDGRVRLDALHRVPDARRSAAEDATLAESIGGMTQAEAAHRAALGALGNAGRLSRMDDRK